MAVTTSRKITLTPEQLRTYNYLSLRNREFFDYIEDDMRYFDLSSFPSMNYIDGISNLSPWPMFMSRETRAEFSRVGCTMAAIMKDIPYKYLQGDPVRIAEYYQIAPEQAEMLLSCSHPAHVQDIILRGDYLLTDKGLMCIEMNGSASLGGIQLPFFEETIFENVLMKDCLGRLGQHMVNENLFDLLFRHVLDCAMRNGSVSGELNIAILSEADKELYKKDFGRMNKRFVQVQREMGLSNPNGTMFHVHNGDLKVKDDQLEYQEKRIVAIIDWEANIPLAFWSLFRKKKLLIFNGHISHIVGSKLSLALLHEFAARGRFDEETTDFIQKHIPWTYKIKQQKVSFKGTTGDLETLMRMHKDELVIKTPLQSSGEGVYIGKYKTVEEWSELVSAAMNAKDWIVQEALEPVPFINISGDGYFSQFNSVWGLFSFGEHYGGAFLRILPERISESNGLVNLRQGATIAVVCDTEL